MKDAQRYADLAAHARRAGYDRVTGSAVQGWVRSGLLPRGQWDHWAFRRRSISYPVITGRQMLALCRLRFADGIRLHDLLALALWLEGWEVLPRYARRGLGLLATNPRRFLTASRAPGADAYDVSNIAVFERGFGAAAVNGGVSAIDLAHGMGDLVLMLAGDLEPSAAGDDGLAAVGRLFGLDRAATDDVTGDGPWLPTTPAAALREAAAVINSPALMASLARTTDEELAWARKTALLISASFADAAHRFAQAGDPGLAGIGPLAAGIGGPLGPGIALLSILQIPTQAREFIDALESRSDGAPELVVDAPEGRGSSDN